MLKPFGILVIFFAIGLSHLCIGQKIKPKASRNGKEDLRNETANITADKIISDGQTITYTGNVSVTTKKITARKAEKAILDRRTNKITIWGSKNFISKCKTVCEDVKSPEDRVEYVLGSGLVRVY
ncbi:LptA/OstA family protein [Dyadobacter sp. MSC1_007]|jgi:lipopolysaccharide export system protein LptA|uniref:LptA/OstA family protein n=1 Tax=Dyadobacter sp. MSC1_007 TaxID=2909264 RepID=UPI00202F72CB|nr:LptA/OstA family protein [Dyadobacter sp. MSC1_007]